MRFVCAAAHYLTEFESTPSLWLIDADALVFFILWICFFAAMVY